MRKNSSIKRHIVAPDYKYNNPAVGKFINFVMKDGKKSIARTVVYGAFEVIETKGKQDPMEVFDRALKNVSPTLEVKSKRVGGANYQVPLQVRGERRNMLAMNWILNAARNAKGKPMAERLAAELLAAANNEGSAVRKKDDTERMAHANRAFAHFA
jgi:small subunit ribosomal protein S7